MWPVKGKVLDGACEAGRLGWNGPWREAAQHALDGADSDRAEVHAVHLVVGLVARWRFGRRRVGALRHCMCCPPLIAIFAGAT